MNDIKAADLPEGSVVAGRDIAYVSRWVGISAIWCGTDGSRVYDAWIDGVLAADGVVLRHGHGDEGEV
uniref:hypothetical protein n=1 Tax=Paractinoplanes polyasparticus TaxID=2856853 RepID=UPI001C864686|nr:hypothetical protein [Actinoplanes polyasparticus]